MSATRTRISRFFGMGILTTLVVILQAFASVFKIGDFSPPLSLIIIIIGAIIFGELGGTILGLVFGVVVVLAIIVGAEPFSMLMLNHNPVITVIICLFKGAIAGCSSGIVYKKLSKSNTVMAIIMASIITPFVNTGIFSITMLVAFYPLVSSFSGTSNTVIFFFTEFIGNNFIFELAFITVLVPILIKIIDRIKERLL